MKTKRTIRIIAATAFLPLVAFAQTPPTPPAPGSPGTPASPPVPPMPPNHHRDDRQPKVPVTYLGVETSDVPAVLSEQLGLAKGFGLVVDYVVPDGPAAAAGVQQNDVIKMLNDQILTDPSQLSKLVRSYQDGTTVTLTVLRKGQEQKLTVKLARKDVPRRNAMMPGMDHGFHFDVGELGDLGNSEQLKEKMSELKERLGDQKEMIREAVTRAREQAREAVEQAREAREQARRDNQHINTTTHNPDGSVARTTIDLGKAQIVFSDDKGELRIDSAGGKKILTAKDPQGKLLFSGPVETKEDLDKLPPEVRDRYVKLEQNDIPAITPKVSNEQDENADENDEDDDDSGATRASLNTVWTRPSNQPVWQRNLILI